MKGRVKAKRQAIYAHVAAVVGKRCAEGEDEDEAHEAASEAPISISSEPRRRSLLAL